MRSYNERNYCLEKSKRSAGVAPEVLLRNPLRQGDKVRKRGIHPGFEIQDRRHQKAETGVSVASQKGLVSSKKAAVTDNVL